MGKTVYRLDWENGFTIERRLTRSFDTLEEAEQFAKGKRIIDIYRSKGRYKVEWLKIKDNNDESVRRNPDGRMVRSSERRT